MDITLDVKKSLEENASDYFERAKKARKKSEAAKKAFGELDKRIKEKEIRKEKTIEKIRKKEWFEKFKWFISSDGFLVIAGRDATTNEIVIKKHTDKNDIVFHTEMSGSPFVVVKADKKIPEQTIKEAAEFTVTNSRAWKRGLKTAEVYWIKPDQVSKQAKSGEYIARGAFMIYGDRNYLNPEVNLAIGVYKDKIMAGPVSAVKKHCKEFLIIIQGDKKTSDVAKKIKEKLKYDDVNDIIAVLPSGGCDVSY
jgi:predicted ribosome quality control (RQC) complex YloA/Tae2 family protein